MRRIGRNFDEFDRRIGQSQPGLPGTTGLPRAAIRGAHGKGHGIGRKLGKIFGTAVGLAFDVDPEIDLPVEDLLATFDSIATSFDNATLTMDIT